MPIDFFKYRNKLKPEKGSILVSEPFLPDPNFERTTILLCEYNQDGSFGFVLNKRAEAQLGEVIEDFKSFDAPVFIGGPVQQDTLHYLHRLPQLEDSTEIVNGIFWGGNFDQLSIFIDTGQISLLDIRFFLGYSGWGEGQLDTELKENSWIVSNRVTPEFVFETLPDEMWKKALQTLGGRYSIYSNYPVDPRMN